MIEKIIVMGRTDTSNVVLPKLCGAISCIIQSLRIIKILGSGQGMARGVKVNLTFQISR